MSKEKNPHAVALGKLGRKKNTDAQKIASKENGKKGGRPKTIKSTEAILKSCGE